MKNLSKSTAKKGDTVIEVVPWNHHWNSSYQRDHDVYAYAVWEIGSIGKKELKLKNEKENKGSTHFADRDGNFGVMRIISHNPETEKMEILVECNKFAFSLEDVEKVVAEMREKDQYSTPNFQIKKVDHIS